MFDFKLLTGTGKVHFPSVYIRDKYARFPKARTLCGLNVEERIVFDLEVNCLNCIKRKGDLAK